jgi:AraC family transcriptional regulator of adaptative response/methylated-DNA-[protein]-cysteine methyltransferase
MSSEFDQIVNVIRIVRENSDGDLSPNELASKADKRLSELDLLFERWAGTDTSTFFRYLRPAFIKSQLNREITLFDDRLDSSASSRVKAPNQFIEIEPMKPEDLNRETEIFYSTGQTRYGEILIGSTEKGVCLITFIDGKFSVEDYIRAEFPNGKPIRLHHKIHKTAVEFFQGNLSERNRLKLHLKGTPFQINVWKAVLEIPEGEVETYGKLAEMLINPKAYRAVGAAVGQNLIAYIIPCHRVIASNGVVGDYRWGSDRKRAMLGREMAENKNARHQ